MIQTQQIPENPGPIIGAGTRDIVEGASTLPNMHSATIGWFRPLTVVLVTTTIIAGLANQVKRPIATSGVLQPMHSREIILKPEGDRSYRWFTLHADIGLQLNLNDIAIIRNVTYRVMGRWDWRDAGFIKYDLVEGASDRVS